MLPGLGHFWSKDRCRTPGWRLVQSTKFSGKNMKKTHNWRHDDTLLTDPLFRICFLMPLSDSPRVAKSFYQEPHRLQLHDLRFAFRASDSVIIKLQSLNSGPLDLKIAKSKSFVSEASNCIFYIFEVVAFFIWTYVILSTWQTAVSVVPTQAQWNKSVAVSQCFCHSLFWLETRRPPQVQRLPGGWCAYPKPIGGTMQASQKLVRIMCNETNQNA